MVPYFYLHWVNGCFCLRLVQLTLSYKEQIGNIGIPLDVFGFCIFNNFLNFSYGFANQLTVHNGGVYKGRVCGCGCWMLVSSDRWQLTRDTWHMKHGAWHMTSDTWHLTYDFNFTPFYPFLSMLVLVVVSAHITKFSISRMRYLLAYNRNKALAGQTMAWKSIRSICF